LICKNRLCSSCGIDVQDGRMPPEDFNKYLPWFLEDNPSSECPKGGHALYGQAVVLHNFTTPNTPPRIGATYFMTFHTVLKTSRDYSEAMNQARIIAANITKTLNTGLISKYVHYYFLCENN